MTGQKRTLENLDDGDAHTSLAVRPHIEERPSRGILADAGVDIFEHIIKFCDVPELRALNALWYVRNRWRYARLLQYRRTDGKDDAYRFGEFCALVAWRAGVYEADPVWPELPQFPAPESPVAQAPVDPEPADGAQQDPSIYQLLRWSHNVTWTALLGKRTAQNRAIWNEMDLRCVRDGIAVYPRAKESIDFMHSPHASVTDVHCYPYAAIYCSIEQSELVTWATAYLGADHSVPLDSLPPNVTVPPTICDLGNVLDLRFRFGVEFNGYISGKSTTGGRFCLYLGGQYARRGMYQHFLDVCPDKSEWHFSTLHFESQGTPPVRITASVADHNAARKSAMPAWQTIEPFYHEPSLNYLGSRHLDRDHGWAGFPFAIDTCVSESLPYWYNLKNPTGDTDEARAKSARKSFEAWLEL